ncbi:MAG TPA: hypothetical protein PK523_02105 [Elusimicrobiales bacterium]|nr:hypothetical protein [Elusimicrobiales bacterium]
MNDSPVLRTSAAALAFFLGPLAWAEPWHESGIAEEPSSVSSPDEPGPSLPVASLPF